MDGRATVRAHAHVTRSWPRSQFYWRWENLREARTLAAASEPGALVERSPAEAVGRQVERFAQETGADAAHGVSWTPRRLPAEREVLLRAAQELLADVARHASAGTATVRPA